MSPRSATVFAVPTMLWDTDDMLDALAARDIAQVFRLVQRETRVSQTHLGVATGLSQAQVSEIICGSMPGDDVLSERFSDLTAIYPSRSEFTSKMPPYALFDCAREIRAAGLSLNFICQQYADTQLAQTVRDGAHLRLLFLDPAGAAIRAREAEEGQQAGQLSALTALNLQGVLRVRDRLPVDVRERIEVATYDQPIRFNITLINGELCIAQPYLPHARGVESPTMVINKRWPSAGLYPVFDRVFDELWDGGQPR